MEHSALQAGAANRIRLTPELLTYELGGEPGNRTQSRVNAWHVSSVLAYHLPRSPVAPGHGFEPRVTALETVSLTIGNPGMKMEESGGIEPRWLSTSPRFSGALGDHSPALSLEHPAAVETANTWVAITSLLLFAFGCTRWYPARDSNSEYPDPKSGGFASFPSRAKSRMWLGLIATESG
jgi:hypothetical protein